MNMAKNIKDEIEKLIKMAIRDKKLVIGSKETIKGVKNGKIKAVVYASNCPKNKIKDLNHYTTLSNIDLKKFEGDSKKLGELCGKPFNTIIIGIVK